VAEHGCSKNGTIRIEKREKAQKSQLMRTKKDDRLLVLYSKQAEQREFFMQPIDGM
jgi:hypothetical protein